MQWPTPLRWCSASTAFNLLGRVPLRGRPRYTQQQSATQKIMDAEALLTASRRRVPSRANVTLMEVDQGCQLSCDALCEVPGAGNDDIVMDPAHGQQLREIAAATERERMGENHPATRGIGTDVIDLVTDAFKDAREKLVAKRRRVLYELTHPIPSDYQYNGKLVPPPPLSFGRITEEAITLGNKVMLGQHYSLVKQAGMYRDDVEQDSTESTATTTGRQRRWRKGRPSLYDNHNYFFEVNELYQEIVLVGKACAGKSSLLNALLGQTVAKTSSTPNTTRKLSFYQSVSPEEMQRYLNVKGNGLVKLPGGGPQLTFVDVPGFGIEGMSEHWRDKAIELTDAYLGVRRSVNTLLLCIDCERGLTKVDLRYFTWLENLHGVFFVVLTKCDSVPHSRVCSVMRQIYATITRNRRKYRKVFPFIIPTSAKDGVNIEMLRGLIAETSGLIPGDRLREILKTKAAAELRVALQEEEARIQEARCMEANMARAYFESTRNASSANANGSTVGASSLTCPISSPVPQRLLAAKNPPLKERKFILSLDCEEGSNAHDMVLPSNSGAEATEPLLALSGDTDYSGLCQLSEGEKAKRRKRFLAWRHAHPLQRHQSEYGVFRLNTGLEQPGASKIELTYSDDIGDPAFGRGGACGSATCTEEGSGAVVDADVRGVDFAAFAGGSADSMVESSERPMTESDRLPSAAVSVSEERSSVVGFNDENSQFCKTSKPPMTGRVSRFLDVIERYAEHKGSLPKSKRDREREARWQARLTNGAPTRLLVEEADGRVAEFKAGTKFGPSFVSAPAADVVGRRGQWASRQYVKQALAACPTAPWSALGVLKKDIERVKQEAAMRGMTKKELEAYLRTRGRVTEGFAKFEGEVTTAKYMNEIRQTKTLRSQQQMHLNSTAKISYRSMPVGLWKHYGDREAYWPTPRVKGH
uniref:EngB-type G domain-containing protein n=1 Tax=Trypanosoma congolense (strain IL3000) TaxID=1068625 RepID=G0UPS3_TRYCI|nr:conserved hypothetical protein [Trypanosoma congolense IL3000]